MKGNYFLILKLTERQEISIGKLGILSFTKGFYTYVGSAMNSLESRISRHLRDGKKNHWHIDYIVDKAEILEIILCETTKNVECRLSESLASEFKAIPGFGCSDCNCSSHLFFDSSKRRLRAGIITAINHADLNHKNFTT